MADSSCVFCKIVSGAAPADRVLEDDDFLGFLDVRPIFVGHVLIVPKHHYVTLLDLPLPLHGPLLGHGQRTARALGIVLGAEGTFVAMNNTISQSVPHLHLHVVPRKKGDGLRGFFWPRTKYPSDAERRQVADSLASEIARER